MKVIAYATLAIVMGACGAVAADLPPAIPSPPVEAPPLIIAPPLVFGGPYVGVFGGFGSNTGQFEFCCGPYVEDFIGLRGGAFVGYNWALTNGVVLGVEGDISYDWNGRPFEGARKVGSDLSGAIRGRIGYAFGNVMPYFAAGWTATNTYVKGYFDDSKTAKGVTLGVGVDWFVTDRTFVRAEYRNNRFSDVNLSGVDAKFNQHVVNIGIGIRF